jgi:hypothetical protein
MGRCRDLSICMFRVGELHGCNKWSSKGWRQRDDPAHTQPGEAKNISTTDLVLLIALVAHLLHILTSDVPANSPMTLGFTPVTWGDFQVITNRAIWSPLITRSVRGIR